MLTADQRASFAARGSIEIARCRRPQMTLNRCAMKFGRSWLPSTGTSRNDSATWTTPRPAGFNRLSRTGALDRLWSPTVDDVLSEVLGTDQQHRERPRVLMTFPRPRDKICGMPPGAWHFDFTPLQDQPGLRAVQVFALLSDVRPQEEGTLVLSGSHQLVSRYVARTGQEPKPRTRFAVIWVRATPRLLSYGDDGTARLITSTTGARLGVPAFVDGVELCVTEVTGKRGDVYIMNSDCFHAIAPNTLAVARA